PQNDRATVITVSGGIGVLMADDAEPCGVEIPAISPSLQARIRELVPFLVGVNPLDTTAQIGAIKRGIPNLVDLVVAQTDSATHFIYLAQIPCDTRRFTPLLADLAELRRKYPDRLLVLVGPSDDAMRRLAEAEGLVIFSDPGRAMRAIGALCEVRRRRSALHPGLPDAGRTAKKASDAPRGALNEIRAKQLLAE